jgi:hypothetical protein
MIDNIKDLKLSLLSLNINTKGCYNDLFTIRSSVSYHIFISNNYVYQNLMNYKDNSFVQNFLGELYYRVSDYDKSIDLFFKSAAQGNLYSFFDLGWMYCRGHGVEKDIMKGLEYLKKSITPEFKMAIRNILDDMEYGIAKYYTNLEEQNLLVEIFHIHASLFNINRMYNFKSVHSKASFDSINKTFNGKLKNPETIREWREINKKYKEYVFNVVYERILDLPRDLIKLIIDFL